MGPLLPHDVLLIIASYCSRKDIMSFMPVSRDFHHDCAKYVLGPGVSLRRDSDTTSFIRFMRPHQKRRWRYLRTLTMASSGDISPDVSDELASALSRASNLVNITFEDAERTLSAHPNLSPAFAAVRSVKHVEVRNGRQHACRMLEAMRWSLETISLDNVDVFLDANRVWNDPNQNTRMHPAMLLKNARETLQELDLRYWTAAIGLLPEYPVYPSLHTLSLEGSWFVQTAQWVITYPHLRRLKLEFEDGRMMGYLPHQADVYADQRRLNRTDHLTKGTWPELEIFIGDPLDLYLSGIPCRIRKLLIRVIHSHNLQFLPTALDDSHPEYLSLCINTSVLLLGVQGFAPRLADTNLSDLRILHIDILLEQSKGVDLEAFISSLQTPLAKCSALRTLNISFTPGSGKWDADLPANDSEEIRNGRARLPSFSPRHSPYIPGGLEVYNTEVDMKKHAQSLLEATCPLKTVNIAVWRQSLQGTALRIKAEKVEGGGYTIEL
ncbi:uncharacterized protein BXZ73DRAFT_98727 [Epithele typhae]|uniref:uncharacterized protein n=1 Tax=Epithele typhae TaxID=378194 RepID=UPI0020086C1F|nr:uncharacterized protein BXZ73DRAFT_98727 [Epithele typhae]KAH9940897.1 hypothetical protein BXZ73DRAFT_98727 [Epithele typhae]